MSNPITRILQWHRERRDMRRRRQDWRPVRTWQQELVWTDRAGESAGFTIIIGFENGLGERRTKIVQKPRYPGDPSQPLLAKAALWEFEPRPHFHERPALRLVR